MAGGCAAVEAASNGARVLVLERAAVAGGTTSLAGGHFYLGGGTAVQEGTGHADSAEEMRSTTAVSADPDPEKIHAYCQGQRRALHLARSASASASNAATTPEKGRHPAPDPGPDVHRQREGVAVPRHRGPCPAWPQVPSPGDTGGASLVIELLVKKLAELGVEIRYDRRPATRRR